MSQDESTAIDSAGDASSDPGAQETAVKNGAPADTPANSENTENTENTEAVGPTEDTPQRHKPKQNKQKAGTARKTRTVTLTLTVTGTADGEWQAELKHGSTWVARGLEVPAAAVSRAAKELHDELSVPIDEVINAAREQQQARVAQLEAELEEARQTLANLDES